MCRARDEERQGRPNGKKEQRIRGEFRNPEWPGVTGSYVTLCWVLPGPLSDRTGSGDAKGTTGLRVWMRIGKDGDDGWSPPTVQIAFNDHPVEIGEPKKPE